ncbi:hypothetical protein [Streptomyces sp. NBC_00233]|uniref:hypothetical protein n=1 Tax=Streptomyces sp. NBC_00233 TaxID=2975686 RepID=UPI00224F0D3C|nr:hypothetical protein [Streptomyces sp. NBC_00233]MCX5228989.1 hypothetical protein [Streptomyces sp. NBC_00233]
MLRIEAVSINSVTTGGVVKFSTRFGQGLTVIRAQNSSGKTLLLNSMMYALGLEGTLKPGKQGVLTTALTRSVRVNGTERPVNQSWIDLEVSNGTKFITVRRYPVPPEGIKADLITVWEGPLLSDPPVETPEPRYYYVGRGGTAQNEAGFHHFLAKFLEWELPSVPTYNGKEVPLYLQVLASLFFVEQKQGWSGIVPRMPTQYQIREPLRRSIEFYFQLDVMELARRRADLQQRLTVLRAEYSALRGALDAAAQVANARVVGVSEFGSSTFYRNRLFGATSGEVEAGVVLMTYRQNEWEALQQTIDRLKVEIDRTSNAMRSRLTGAEATTLGTRLAELRVALRRATIELQSLDDSASMLDMQRGMLEKRRRLLEQELRRYKDIQALENLGAQFSRHAIAHHDCPTCEQSLDGIESISGAPVLSTVESTALVGQQLETVTNVIVDAERSATANGAARGALEQQSSDLRAQIRAIQADLEGDSPSISLAEVQAKMTAENRYRELIRIRDSAQVIVNDLLDCQNRAIAAKRELDSLGDEELTAGDLRKLDLWERKLQGLLASFGFQVFSPREITIDPQGMRPAHGESDLGFQGSASDGLKLRWAYLLSLVEASAQVDGLHPGILLLDGPRMYDVEPPAMRSFLRSCSQLSGSGGRAQIILTLSEDPEVISEWLSGCAFSVVSIPERLLA